MVYRIPEFPITCNISTGPWIGRHFREAVDCNLAFGVHALGIPQNNAFPDTTVGQVVMQLLLPAETDIRSGLLVVHPDIVEVPANSERWYQVYAVDDVGKGFDNEHRIAILLAISFRIDPVVYAGCIWPIPMP